MKDPDTNNNIIRGKKDVNNILSGQTQMTVRSCKYSDPTVKDRDRERGSSDLHKIIIMQNKSEPTVKDRGRERGSSDRHKIIIMQNKSENAKDNKNEDTSSRTGPYQLADKDNSTIRDKKAWKLMWIRGHWKDCWTYTRIAICITAITLLLYDK